MREMSRNEHFIRNILALVEHMLEQNLEEDVKKYINELEFNDAEKNSLYAKCIYQLKSVERLSGKEYAEALKEICHWYLEYETEESRNPIKRHVNLRKKKYKQLNLDMPKELMEQFETCLKANKTTKKAVIKKAIENYIAENEKNS